MGALLKLILTIPFIAILLWLSFANRETVTFIWSPFHEPADIAISVIVLFGIIAGFIWGALITWINYGPSRRAARINRSALNKLEKDLSKARDHKAGAQASPASAALSSSIKPSPESWTP